MTTAPARQKYEVFARVFEPALPCCELCKFILRAVFRKVMVYEFQNIS